MEIVYAKCRELHIGALRPGIVLHYFTFFIAVNMIYYFD